MKNIRYYVIFIIILILISYPTIYNYDKPVNIKKGQLDLQAYNKDFCR